MIELRSVVLRYGAVVALDGLDLEVGTGERLALIGPSGAGKTSLLRVIAGLERPRSGEILIDGRVVSSRSVHRSPSRRGVAMAFQRPALWPHLTVEANVAWTLRSPRSTESRRRTASLLARLGLEDQARRRPHELSGGEARRASIARALAAAPPIVLLDEPFAGLDSRLREAVADLILEEVGDHGSTLLAAVHDLEAARILCSKTAAVEFGRITRAGSWDEPENDR